jgi:phosphoketolase
MAEAMMNEMPDISRVFFVPDANTATAIMQEVYLTRGEIWTIVTPKSSQVPNMFSESEAMALVRDGGMRLEWAGYESKNPRLLLTAVGAYQLEQLLRASERLCAKKVPHAINYLCEPVRFCCGNNLGDCDEDDLRAELYPAQVRARIFITHTRPQCLLGWLNNLNTGSGETVVLGFINHGGTLNVDGMLFVNHCTWAHVLRQAAAVLNMAPEQLLSAKEIAALEGKVSPHGVIL